jgi:hypothetical protein
VTWHSAVLAFSLQAGTDRPEDRGPQVNQPPRAVRRTARSLLIAAAVAATALAGAVPAGAATRPALTLEASRASVTVYRYTDGDEAYMDGDLGVYAVADVKQAFEVRTTRKDYASPLVARLVRKGHDRTLPVPTDLTGLKDFSRTTFRNSAGKVVTTSTSPFCPNVPDPVRRSPKAPATSPYPEGCDANPTRSARSGGCRPATRPTSAARTPTTGSATCRT